MHEFSIAQGILETALTEAEKNNGKCICALGVKLGRASHIEPDSLEFCLRAAAKGTIAEKARIEIKPSEPTARCKECGPTFLAQGNELFCGVCRSENVEMLTGGEVFLESLEVD